MPDSRTLLYVPKFARALCGASAELRAPLLEKFFARARRSPLTSGLKILASQFGLEREGFPVAAIERFGGGGARDAHYWWRADPAHLLVDRDQVAMLPRAGLAVTAEEARALAARLNEFYAADQLLLETPRPEVWYLRVPGDWRCCSFDSARVEGWAITEFMPTGPDEDRLRKLMNEIQMLFYDHPVNQAREQTGKLAINSLWLWGGGRLPEGAPRAPDRIITDLPLVRGLAKLADHGCENLSGDVRLDTHSQSTLLGAAGDFGGDPRRFAREVLRPAWAALLRGHTSAVELFLGGDWQYSLSRAAALSFWRRPVPLARSFAPPDAAPQD
ncbi:MAG: hypothetical protein ACRETQ_09575 [Gammaproteobacteria bacterium]